MYTKTSHELQKELILSCTDKGPGQFVALSLEIIYRFGKDLYVNILRDLDKEKLKLIEVQLEKGTNVDELYLYYLIDYIKPILETYAFRFSQLRPQLNSEPKKYSSEEINKEIVNLLRQGLFQTASSDRGFKKNEYPIEVIQCYGAINDQESLKKLSEDGMGIASAELGVLYLTKSQNELALEYFNKAIEQGHDRAIFLLGKYYKGDNNCCKEPNIEHALIYFNNGAEKGVPEAYLELANYHLNPNNPGGKDIRQALYYLNHAAHLGYMDAKVRLVNVYRKDYKIDFSVPGIVDVLKQQALGGNQAAICHLARLYFYGEKGIENFSPIEPNKGIVLTLLALGLKNKHQWATFFLQDGYLSDDEYKEVSNMLNNPEIHNVEFSSLLRQLTANNKGQQPGYQTYLQQQQYNNNNDVQRGLVSKFNEQ